MRRMQRHLQRCASCRAALQAEERLSCALGQLPEPQMPAALRTRLIDAARQLPRRRPLPLLLPVGAAAALTAALLLYAGIRYLPGQSAQLRLAQPMMQEAALESDTAEDSAMADTGGVVRGTDQVESAQPAEQYGAKAAQDAADTHLTADRRQRQMPSLRWYHGAIAAGCAGAAGLVLWRVRRRGRAAPK
ncbi:MAG: hypothetical protein PHO66_02990 [Eubacteriales bacterium]|nr:hypothetical protein [Eubacteriales bacterium]